MQHRQRCSAAPRSQHYHQAIAVVVAETVRTGAGGGGAGPRRLRPRRRAPSISRGGEDAAGRPAQATVNGAADTASAISRRLRRRAGAGSTRPTPRPIRPRHDGAARLDRGVERRPADALDLQPDDRLGHGRHRQDARHCRRRMSACLALHRRRLWRQAVRPRPTRCWPRSARRAAGRPVKVALHATAHLQQHHAPAGHDPAHPHRRDAGRQDHRHRPRELVRQSAGRQARDRGQPDPPAVRRRQPHDGHAAGRRSTCPKATPCARPARRRA